MAPPPCVPTLSQWVPAEFTLAPAFAQRRWYVHQSRRLGTPNQRRTHTPQGSTDTLVPRTPPLRSDQCLKRLAPQGTRNTKQTPLVRQGRNRVGNFGFPCATFLVVKNDSFAHEPYYPHTQPTLKLSPFASSFSRVLICLGLYLHMPETARKDLRIPKVSLTQINSSMPQTSHRNKKRADLSN